MAHSSDGKKLLIHNIYEKVIKGRGINRIKMQLARQSGDVAPRKKVPTDVHCRMRKSFKEIAQQKLECQMNGEEGNPFISFNIG